MVHISIVIPYFNDTKILDCLQKISQDFSNLKKSLKKKFEIIIINDGSKKIKTTNKNLPIKFVHKKKNEGVGKSRNDGLKISKGKFILFLDSDVIIPDNFLNKILFLIKKKGKKIFYFPQSFIPANKDPNLFQNYLSSSWYINQTKDFKNKEMLTSFCLLVEKKYFLEIGGFSEKFKKSGGEEFELISRIDKKNVSVCKDINCYHFQDTFLQRFKKLYFRSKNFRNFIVQNKNIPFKTKFLYSIKIINSILFFLSIFFIFFSKEYSIFFFIFLIILILSEYNFFSFLLRQKKLLLIFSSIFFKSLENVIIAFGLLMSY